MLGYLVLAPYDRNWEQQPVPNMHKETSHQFHIDHHFGADLEFGIQICGYWSGSEFDRSAIDRLLPEKTFDFVSTIDN